MRRFLSGLLLVGLAGSPAALAESRSAEMNVSVTVVARTILTMAGVPTDVVVTDADVARGYVLIPAAMAFRVRSNSLGGYMLRFESLDPQFARASISWNSTEVVVSEGEAEIAQPYHRGSSEYSATVRLDLAPGTGPGRYGWPVRITAETL